MREPPPLAVHTEQPLEPEAPQPEQPPQPARSHRARSLRRIAHCLPTVRHIFRKMPYSPLLPAMLAHAALAWSGSRVHVPSLAPFKPESPL